MREMGFKLLYSDFQVSEPQWKHGPGCPGKSAQECWRSGARGLSVVRGGVSAHGSILSSIVLKVVGNLLFVGTLENTAVLVHCWGITGSACLSRIWKPIVVMMMISVEG